MLPSEQEIEKIVASLGDKAFLSTKAMEHVQFAAKHPVNLNGHSYIIKLNEPLGGEDLDMILRVVIANIYGANNEVTDLIGALKDILDSEASLLFIELDMHNDQTYFYFSGKKSVIISTQSYNHNVSLLKEYKVCQYSISTMLSYSNTFSLVS